MPSLAPQLIALCAAISYAAGIISSRFGLRYSTPVTMTGMSLMVHTVTLWSGVFLTGGIPEVAPRAVGLFVIVGLLMPVIRLLTYTGIARIGAAHNTPLRSTHPLFSVLIAITVLREEASLVILLGTILVVLGVLFISIQPAERPSSYRRWSIVFPLSASFLAGIVQPIVRYGLGISNHPLLYAALVGLVSLLTFLGYLALPSTHERPVWNRKAIGPFTAAAVFETLGFLLFNASLSAGPVVFVSPIVGSIPMWVLIGTVLVMRDLEKVTWRTVAGTCFVLTGTVSVTLAG